MLKQSNVTINNCVFENGKYGLYANLTYGGSGISPFARIWNPNWRVLKGYLFLTFKSKIANRTKGAEHQYI
jgi:hypothetical protein